MKIPEGSATSKEQGVGVAAAVGAAVAGYLLFIRPGTRAWISRIDQAITHQEGDSIMIVAATALGSMPVADFAGLLVESQNTEKGECLGKEMEGPESSSEERHRAWRNGSDRVALGGAFGHLPAR